MKKYNSLLKFTILSSLTLLLLSCVTSKYKLFEKEDIRQERLCVKKTATTENGNTTEQKVTSNELCFLNRCPTGAHKNDYLVNHQIYILSSNPKTKFADWVAYTVNKANLSGPSRARNWKKDPKIPLPDTLSPEDYKGAAEVCDYDRGHQAPLASFSNSPYWERTNYLSNITPQKAPLNRGAWMKLESAVRQLVSNGSTVYVITGPIYQRNVHMCTLPKKPNLVIPTAYFKIIFKAASKGIVNYAAFIMPQNAERKASMCKFVVPLKKIREMTGLKFLDDEIERNETLLKPLGC